MPARLVRLAVGVTCAMFAWNSLADDRTAGAPTFTDS
ncbi:MAG: hypothetical protein V7640_1966, partial [Betaproteobacteria bacterium]